jgi:hypothetical protein
MQLTLQTETGTEITAEIRPLRVRDFPAAFAAFERDEEWRLLALAAAPQDPPLPVGWPQTLKGDSYTAAAHEFQRENQAFFGYCARIAQNRLMRDPGALASVFAAARGSAGATSSPTSPSAPA